MANEDKATRYHRLQRRASVAAVAAVASVLALLLLAGGAVWLRRLVLHTSGGGFVAATTLYAIALIAIGECVQLPFAYYQGVTLERRYGLSTHSRAHWWLDRLKAFGLAVVFGVAAALVVWGMLRLAPRAWWVFASVVFTAVTVVLAQLAPVVLLPIFYKFTPLQRPELVERLVALGRRANAHVSGVFEWRLGDRTRKANAALAGLGRTRRILLSDTLLSDHSDDEIEVILAHELAHHVHHDIWSGMAIDAALTTLGFFAADRVLVMIGPWLGLSGKADLAGMPLVVLAAGAVAVMLAPISHAISRRHERRADRYALEMTGNADAFVSAMKRLAVQNLAEERPSRLTEVLFHSHPSSSARIAAARRWTAARSATPPAVPSFSSVDTSRSTEL
jgi:STE24 endopeptidase